MFHAAPARDHTCPQRITAHTRRDGTAAKHTYLRPESRVLTVSLPLTPLTVFPLHKLSPFCFNKKTKTHAGSVSDPEEGEMSDGGGGGMSVLPDEHTDPPFVRCCSPAGPTERSHLLQLTFITHLQHKRETNCRNKQTVETLSQSVDEVHDLEPTHTVTVKQKNRIKI